MLPFREDVHFLLPGRYLGVLAVQVPRLQNFLIYLGDPWNRFCNLISKVPVFPPLASKELRSLFFWYCSLHWPEIATCFSVFPADGGMPQSRTHFLRPTKSATLPLCLATVSKCFQAEAMIHVFMLSLSPVFSFLLGFYAVCFFIFLLAYFFFLF